MARHTGPKCRLCRREGQKLFLKGARCESTKCSVDRRDQPPGVHAWRRGRRSDYGQQLREKQKLKRLYGVFERQFRRYFDRASRARNTGDMLLQLLERRLDNVVTRLGLAASRPSARQFITHGHITVNGRKVDRPSYQVRAGAVVGVKPVERSQKLIRAAFEACKGRTAATWLSFDEAKLEGKVESLPTRDDASIPIEQNLIIELCSK